MHRNFAIVVLLVVFVGGAFAQSGPQNLGFEDGQAGALPSGWLATTKGYSVQLTREQAKAGAYCAELTRTSQTDAAPFGNLMQNFDAALYRGKRVRFRAAVRTELASEGDRAALWLRVDRPKGEMGFFDNMMDRPIRTHEWSYYEITGDIDPDATRINIGVMLLASGKVWIDDASFEILGDAPKVTIEAARPLTPRGLQNLTAFARLYGYVRFFHPSDEAANADWEAFAINGVRLVEGASSDSELAQVLSSIFHPVAPTVAILPAGSRYKLPGDLLLGKEASDRKITYWSHYGVGLKTAGVTSLYHSERVQKVPSEAGNAPLPQTPWRAELGGVTAWVPLALYVDSRGTLPHLAVAEKPPTAAAARYSGDDRATRLADVIIAWNIFQHFYPYFDVVGTDWPAALRPALNSAATDPDAAAFTLTLRRLVHELHDGHGGVYRTSSGFRLLPLRWDWVEDKLVITAVGPSAKTQIAPGDAVVSINGRPAAEALGAAEALVSGATPQWARFRALQELASSPTGATSANLVIQPFRQPGRKIPVTLAYEPASPTPIDEPRPAKFAEVEPGVFYLDPARMSNEEFTSVIAKLERARGIVFDFRGYPRIGPDFLTHLTDVRLTSAQWHVPVVLWPDGHEMKFERGGEWDLKPSAPLLKAKIAFITDGRAISYAESCMGIVEHYKLGAIVGAPTAGTNGNVNPFTLPGGYNVTWTGMKVLKHDGSRHHGVGIAPTIPVKRTRAAIAAGQDEFLQAALEAVRK